MRRNRRNVRLCQILLVIMCVASPTASHADRLAYYRADATLSGSTYAPAPLGTIDFGDGPIEAGDANLVLRWDEPVFGGDLNVRQDFEVVALAFSPPVLLLQGAGFQSQAMGNEPFWDWGMSLSFLDLLKSEPRSAQLLAMDVDLSSAILFDFEDGGVLSLEAIPEPIMHGWYVLLAFLVLAARFRALQKPTKPLLNEFARCSSGAKVSEVATRVNPAKRSAKNLKPETRAKRRIARTKQQRPDSRPTDRRVQVKTSEFR